MLPGCSLRASYNLNLYLTGQTDSHICPLHPYAPQESSFSPPTAGCIFLRTCLLSMHVLLITALPTDFAHTFSSYAAVLDLQGLSGTVPKVLHRVSCAYEARSSGHGGEVEHPMLWYCFPRVGVTTRLWAMTYRRIQPSLIVYSHDTLVDAFRFSLVHT